MDGETSDRLQHSVAGEVSGSDGRGRLAAQAYRPSRIDVDAALRNDWLEIWYQPKIDLRDKSLIGAEALARIRHPQLGIFLPKAFLSAMSEASHDHLTEHALRAALRDWSLFDAAGFNLRLSINATVGALQRLPIDALTARDRPQAKHWPGVILEVTEAEIVRDLDAAQRLAAELRIEHLSISVDDAGAHWAALSRYHGVGLAEFKLDVGVVKNCASDAAHAGVCQAVIDLAHGLGSTVVAEGIESGADLHALEMMGCDFGQGVLIGPPMPVQGFLDLLQRQRGKPMLSALPRELHAQPAPQLSGVDQIV